MHYDIIIVTKENININIFNDLNILYLPKAIVNELNVNNYTFDYLIIDQIYPGLNLLTEDDKIITNQFFKTSIEQIYAIGEVNNSNLDITAQLKIIIDDIKNPF